ncbi:MAG: single-stranded DNA-binding protein [Dysgonamonadaceae bacterium]|jgi:single-strand DNA-binding protein|nr:single-stranded DNA-binding protein [Dysgonamonadaceae bacterium]MDD3356634.1 single-stranded DNA-binding protein [Dysgonamonadaceae bacterium]MDD3727498.1 single-stranded DNA-binding protein [Dysgonamonadaceae bacterium]MDD4246371.1 single-stranded DNA-binding protein [Dysgonamonadaceae bacterium]MDD4604693.1 single-stranded DNA-binding protein [Dysgonamonadaceae bacterium]
MAVNKVILIGNVGKDPEVKYFDDNNAVANFSLATSERGFKAANGTEVPERTEWHNIVCWRGLAKIAEQFVKKGSQIYIEGKIRTRSYDDKNGVKRYVTEVYADSLELLGRRGDSQSSADSPSGRQQSSAPSSSSPSVDTSEETDDLPF